MTAGDDVYATIGTLQSITNIPDKITFLKNDLILFLKDRFPIGPALWMSLLRPSTVMYPEEFFNRKAYKIRKQCTVLGGDFSGEDLRRNCMKIRREK